MSYLIELLLILAILLIVVTLVGHGLWVFFARIFGSHSPAATREPCPRCNLQLPRSGGCPGCGWANAPSPQARLTDSLSLLQTQIISLARRGLLDGRTRDHLLQSLADAFIGIPAEPKPVVSARAASFQQPTATLAEADSAQPILAELAPQPGLSPVEIPAVPATESPAATDWVPAQLVPEAVESAPRTTEPLRQSRDIAQRARDYAARQAALADNLGETAPAPPSSKPRRPFAEVFAAFLEQSNIRWGEFVGGLLIVCCSIALVISFWSAIAERPFLKFFVFNGVTAAIFAVGFYSFRRWRLENTSQGLLLIGTLLVPLNFLAIAAIAHPERGFHPLTLAGEAFSSALFAGLVALAARQALKTPPLLLTIGVIVPSILTLVIRRHVDAATPPELLATLAGGVIASFLATNGWQVVRAGRGPAFGAPQAWPLLVLLGASAFAIALPLGLLLVNSEQPAVTLRNLAPLCVPAALPCLGVGAIFWTRLMGTETGALRTVGATVGLLGLALILVGNLLAWPLAGQLLLSALLTAIVTAFLALALRIPAALWPPVACAAWIALLAALLARGDISWASSADSMLQSVLSPFAAAALTAIALLWGLAGSALAFARRILPLAQPLIGVAAGAAAASIAVAAHNGWGVVNDPSGAAIIFLIQASLVTVGAAWIDRPRWTWLAAALWLLACAQSCVFTYVEVWNLTQPWLMACLSHTLALAAIALVAALLRSHPGISLFAHTLCQASSATALVAAIWTVGLVPWETSTFLAISCGALFAAWTIVSVVAGWEGLLELAKLALLGIVVSITAHVLSSRSWFQSSEIPWLEPWTWQAIGLSVSALALAWLLLRIGLKTLRPKTVVAPSGPRARLASGLVRLRRWITRDSLPFDSRLCAAAIGLLVLLAIYGALPGTVQELSPPLPTSAIPSQINNSTPFSEAAASTLPSNQESALARGAVPLSSFELLSIPHVHAYGWGSWLLWGACLLLLGASARLDYVTWKAVGLVGVLTVAVPLASARWESEAAVASAIRWLTSLSLFTGSALMWIRAPRHLVPLPAAATPVPAAAAPVLKSDPVSNDAINIVALILATIPLAAMLGAFALSTALRGGVPGYSSLLIAPAAGIAAMIAVVAWLSQRKPFSPDAPAAWRRQVSSLGLFFSIVLLAAVSLHVLTLSIQQNPVLGPNPGSWFARIPPAASYGFPLLLAGIALAGIAIRERESFYSVAAALALCLAASAAHILRIQDLSLPFTAGDWLGLAQLNSAALASYALLWMGALARYGELPKIPVELQPRGFALHKPLVALVALAGGLQLLVLASVSGSLFWNGVPGALSLSAGSLWGWISLAIVAAAFFAIRRQPAALWTLRHGWVFVLAGGILTASTIARQYPFEWFSSQALLLAVASAGWTCLILNWLALRLSPSLRESTSPGSRSRTSAVSRWTVLITIASIVVGFRLFDGAPQAPRWVAAATLNAGLLFAALAVWSTGRWPLYAAASQLHVATTILWADANPVGQTFWDFAAAHLVVLALPVPAWLAFERQAIRRRSPAARLILPPWHRVAAWLGIVGAGLNAYSHLAANLFSLQPASSGPWTWLAIASIWVATLTLVWERVSRVSIAAAYLAGLLSCATLLGFLGLSADWLSWTGLMVLAAFNVAASYLWSQRGALRALADRLGRPVEPDLATRGLDWLIASNSLLATLVVALAGWVEWTYSDLALRFGAAQAALAQAIALGLLAYGRRRSQLQAASLLVGALGAVAFGWSWLAPDQPGVLLDRAVIAMAALAGMAALYGLLLSKLSKTRNDWLAAAERVAPPLLVAAALVLVLVMGLEVASFVRHGEAVTSFGSVVTVAITLVVLAAASLVAALVPGRDPLGLSERGRTAYVYAAEALLAVLFLHLRVCLPWLFTGRFRQFWPLIVMLLAFVGVGLGELFRRQKRLVLAEPLERSGALLPLLPVAGFWLVPSEVHFSVVMVAAAAIYSVLSIRRKSFGFGVLAALMANGGLWYLLAQADGWGFIRHPQLWCIPPAVCVLAAAYLNRDRLTDSQFASVRYGATTAIYVTSTADIFINGVAEQPWLPIVLAGLSLAGIFAGIFLRVRSFLILGAGFLILSLLTVIWHAAVDLEQTWIWAATGIVTGILIIALFAVFEKKRDDVLRMVDEFKHWRA